MMSQRGTTLLKKILRIESVHKLSIEQPSLAIMTVLFYNLLSLYIAPYVQVTWSANGIDIYIYMYTCVIYVYVGMKKAVIEFET